MRKSTFGILGGVALCAAVGSAVFLMRDRSRPEPLREPSDGKVQVVASFYPLYFFAQQIGGDTAEVFNVTPAGAEPHDYEPTAHDIARIEKSALLILNGGGLEAWGPAIEQTIDQKQTRIVHAGEGLTTQEIAEEGKNMTDPHVWLSPLLAQRMADTIIQGFISVDPAHTSEYEARDAALKM